MVQPRRLLFQMYEKDLNSQTTSAFDYVGLTNRTDLIDRLLGLSPSAVKVALWVTSAMQMRPIVDARNLSNELIVTIDWDAVGISDRSHRAKVANELIGINFMLRSKGRHKFVINLHYVNPFTRKQHDEVVMELQHERFR